LRIDELMGTTISLIPVMRMGLRQIL